MKVFESAFSLHEAALQLRTQRMEVLAKNIANVDTPNFKARDIDFEQALRETLADIEHNSVVTTHKDHLGGKPDRARGALKYSIPFNTPLDGNTVEMSVEQAKYGKAAAKYQATLRFLESDIGGFRKALRGE